jgi:hypothetical protein
MHADELDEMSVSCLCIGLLGGKIIMARRAEALRG